MPWAENHTKLAHAQGNLRGRSRDVLGHFTDPQPMNEENLMREYIRVGGRVVHPNTGEVLDNKTGAEYMDNPYGLEQIAELHPEVWESKIPEYLAAFKGERVKRAKK